MFVVHSFMNGICNLLVSVCDLGNLGNWCFFSHHLLLPSEGWGPFFFTDVFFSVTENIFNFFSKPVFEAPIFKKRSEADSLTPSFALIFFWSERKINHWLKKQTKALSSETVRLLQKIICSEHKYTGKQSVSFLKKKAFWKIFSHFENKHGDFGANLHKFTRDKWKLNMVKIAWLIKISHFTHQPKIRRWMPFLINGVKQSVNL